METLVAALLLWIAQNTAYDTAGLPPPEVVLLSPEDLTQEFYFEQPDLIPSSGVDDRIQALFAAVDGPHGTIYILRPSSVADAEYFDDPLDNPVFREILLHELVHHVQWQTGQPDTWACPRMGELEAYMLGGRYLAQTHTSDPMPNRRFWAYMYSRC